MSFGAPPPFGSLIYKSPFGVGEDAVVPQPPAAIETRYMLLETGGYMLLETGDVMLLEDAAENAILLEDGTNLLLEDGTNILLE